MLEQHCREPGDLAPGWQRGSSCKCTATPGDGPGFVTVTYATGLVFRPPKRHLATSAHVTKIEVDRRFGVFTQMGSHPLHVYGLCLFHVMACPRPLCMWVIVLSLIVFVDSSRLPGVGGPPSVKQLCGPFTFFPAACAKLNVLFCRDCARE